MEPFPGTLKRVLGVLEFWGLGLESLEFWGFGVESLGFGVLQFRVARFRVLGLFRVEGFGFRVM